MMVSRSILITYISSSFLFIAEKRLFCSAGDAAQGLHPARQPPATELDSCHYCCIDVNVLTVTRSFDVSRPVSPRGHMDNRVPRKYYLDTSVSFFLSSELMVPEPAAFYLCARACVVTASEAERRKESLSF